MGRDPNSFSKARPSDRMPVPASRTMISPSARSSTQVVLPPYRMVAGPGIGIAPRTPQSFRRAEDAGTVAMDYGGRSLARNFRETKSFWRETVTVSSGDADPATDISYNAEI